MRVAEELPALAEASRTVGSPQIRNRGTIGGNLGTASPAGDALPPLLVEGAEVDIASVRGERRMPLADFLLGVKRNALEPDELVVSVRVAPSRARQTFMKVGPAERDGDRRLLARARTSTASAASCARRSARPPRPCASSRRRSPRPQASRSSSPRARARSTTSAAPPPTAATRSGSSRAARSRGASREDRADRQRRAPRGRRLGRREPPLRAARAARPARLEERLRAGRVRIVLGAARRHARLLVPRPRRAGRRARGRHRRGHRLRTGRCTACRRRSSPRAPCSAASARRG